MHPVSECVVCVVLGDYRSRITRRPSSAATLHSSADATKCVCSVSGLSVTCAVGRTDTGRHRKRVKKRSGAASDLETRRRDRAAALGRRSEATRRLRDVYGRLAASSVDRVTFATGTCPLVLVCVLPETLATCTCLSMGDTTGLGEEREGTFSLMIVSAL